MSHRKGNHDENDAHDGHDERYRFKMRLPSPLPDEVEQVMTRVIDCGMHVHRELGPGFIESIYKQAMCIALEKALLPFECEKPIRVMYEDVPLKGQRVDLIVADCVVVELKSVTRFEEIHTAQGISYLRTLKFRAGLLMNFRVPLLHLGLKRIVL